VLIKLGLNDELPPAKPCSETDRPPPPDEQASAVEKAILQLELLERPLVEPTAASENSGVEDLAQDNGVPDDGAPEEPGEAVLYWLARFDRNPAEAVRYIRKLAAKAPERVVATVLPRFRAGSLGEASRFLASLLSRDHSTAAKLCDPEASLDGSVSVVKALTQHEPNFDARFAKDLLHDDQMTAAARQRGLEVLKRLDTGSRLIHILIQFLRDPDTRIQSKAAMMFGQILSARGIMERLVRDQDARVRANFVEGLWKSTDTDGCRQVFRHALKDTNHRVVGNALVGLHRLGENHDVIGHLAKMAGRPEALFRAAAAWVMGQIGEDRYTGVLRQMVRDSDSMVRLNALRSLRRINLACAANTAASADNHTNGAQSESAPCSSRPLRAEAPPPDTPLHLE